MIIAALLLFAVAPATVAESAVAADNVVEPDPNTMTRQEIREFNAALPPGHKYYIKCRSTVKIGTLTGRITECRTANQWTHMDRDQNDQARKYVQDQQVAQTPN